MHGYYRQQYRKIQVPAKRRRCRGWDGRGVVRVVFNTIVAPNIRRIMKSRCMKQGLVAAKAGYNPQKFSNMLNGRKIIKDEDMFRIAETLGVEVGALFGKEGEDDNRE